MSSNLQPLMLHQQETADTDSLEYYAEARILGQTRWFPVGDMRDGYPTEAAAIKALEEFEEDLHVKHDWIYRINMRVNKVRTVALFGPTRIPDAADKAAQDRTRKPEPRIGHRFTSTGAEIYDYAAHIARAFEHVPSGTFLSVAQIAEAGRRNNIIESGQVLGEFIGNRLSAILEGSVAPINGITAKTQGTKLGAEKI